MHPRRIHALGAAVLAAALTLTACGSGSDGKGSPLDKITVSGGSDTTAPTVKVQPQPLTVSETTTKVVKAGDGPTVTGDEIVSISYVLLNGKDSSVLDTNYGKQNLGLNLGANDLLPGLKKGLKDQKVGSRILVAMPPKDAFGTQGNSELKVGAKDTVVFLMDVKSATRPLASAEGKAVKPAPGLPTVSVEPGQQATITMPKNPKAPTKTIRQPLIEGTGPKVESGQTVRVAYTGAVLSTGKVFDSSAKTPQKYFETVIGKQQVIKGWDSTIVGSTVGSRLLLLVPPADGYGAAGQPQAGIKGTDTLVFVVDILAAY